MYLFCIHHTITVVNFYTSFINKYNKATKFYYYFRGYTEWPNFQKNPKKNPLIK